MKVIANKKPSIGVMLSAVPFGSVVTRAFGGDGETLYLVVSTSDGTGNRFLVTLQGGVPKYEAQDLRVIPVDAHVVIGEADPAAGQRSYPGLALVLDSWADAAEGLRGDRLGAIALKRNFAQDLRAAAKALRPGAIQWVPASSKFDRCENCGYAK